MRRGFALGVLVGLLVVVTGCGGAGPSVRTAGPGLPATVPEEPAAAKACTPLYVVGDSEEATRSFELEADEICRRFGVRPELRFPPHLTTELDSFVREAGDEVDLVIIPPRHLDLFISQGLIQPVDQWIDTTDPWFTDILPVYRNLYMRFGDRFYGFVYDGDTHLLFYRKDLFERLDLEPPETWAEYDAAARALAGTEYLPGGTRYGTAIIGRENKAYMWFVERYASLGGKYFDANMRPQVDSPLAVQVLEDLARLQREVAPEALYDWEDLNRALFAGTVPMAVQFSDTARFSYDTEVWKSQVAGRLGWTDVPGQAQGAPRGGIFFGRVLVISSRSRQPDVAAAVAKYVTSPEVSGRMITRADTINDPYRYSHLAHPEQQTLFPSPDIAADLYAAVERSLERPMADLTIPGGWSYTQALDRAVLKVLRGEASAEEALHTAAAEWEDITNRLGRESQALAYRQWSAWVRQGNR
ncbi:MAG: extracellular solute-binding protein [Symbiobacterium sp.]|uniref:ABC transporter substrate-binding protein n=1 Tax=Symbiobacterium sp. TaxID=1971213 RepID=UPI003464A749